MALPARQARAVRLGTAVAFGSAGAVGGMAASAARAFPLKAWLAFEMSQVDGGGRDDGLVSGEFQRDAWEDDHA